MSKKRKNEDLAFEDSLNDDWSHDLSTAEVPIGNRPLLYLGVVILLVIAAVAVRVVYLNWGGQGAYYKARAEDNMAQYDESPAPRGAIYDREGDVLAQSVASFAAVLDAREFVKNESLRADTVRVVRDTLNISPDDLATLVNEASAEDFATPIILTENLTQTQLVNLQALNLSTIKVESDFTRKYPAGAIFSSVVGYTGRVSQADLRSEPTLNGSDFIGKIGVEAFYDKTLRGKPGITVEYKDAQGKILRKQRESTARAGEDVHLTIDGGFQSYLSARLASGLASPGRTIGLGIAIDPRNGEILSLVNVPNFDNNLFSRSGSSTVAQIKNLLTSPLKPLFNRSVNGYYSPGSTIKPLVGVAALKENVIGPTRQIFSNGYLMVPNPYNSSTPSKYLDWRYQGNVDLSSALAQSSDVYFYIVGGGSPTIGPKILNDQSDYGIDGLGISRLHDWWQKFGLGKPTGVDMPNESVGFLPTPDWKEQHSGTPWLLGDTYNVSIGQGDLLVSPLQLLNYIAAIGNGGKIYQPFLNASSTPQVSLNLTDLSAQIKEVQKGMRETVTSPQGTAYTLRDLPVDVCAKTGSAQVQNNAQENALFVGYSPCNDPQVAILILIENSREGSLNAVPIVKDVLNWYYFNRIKNTP